MKIKVDATRTTINEKYESWDEETQEYVEYDNYTRLGEDVFLRYEHKTANLKRYAEGYCYLDAKITINEFKDCKNINDCIEVFKTLVKDDEGVK